MNIHPAHRMPFAALCAGLEQACAAGLVKSTDRDGASLYCYTKDCVYQGAWNDITKLARGLIIDHAAGKIIGTPFPKFFNLSESHATIPDLPFEAFDKIDGSLIILYHHRGRWRAATKGSLYSEQAQWAEQQVAKANTLHLGTEGTFLCEAIYPTNRIVVHYPFEGLVLLGAYQQDGLEISHNNVRAIAANIGWRCVVRREFGHLSELVTAARTLSVQEEGWVLRFANGERIKIKGDEYCRVHRLISNCTPLALWESMMNGDDLRAIRRDLPEEFWLDFDKITGILAVRLATFLHQIDTAVESVEWAEGVDDREIGKTLRARFPGPWADFVFHRRKKGTVLPPCDPTKTPSVPTIRRAVFTHVRPTSNQLPGYTPSAAVHRVQADAP